MKKEILIPVLLLLLGFVFIIINVIVYVSGGNSWLIGKKLKIGALILSLTGIFSCGSPPKPTCYELPPLKKYIDSMANVRKQDSIKEAEKQKLVDDSIANINEQRKKDSLAKIKHKKKHPCYMPPKKTCYAPVKINNNL
jgi:hypothetical protein